MIRAGLKKSQRGVALITSLLIVSMATVAAVSMASQLQIEIRRTGNIISRDQAYMYTIAAEDFARYGLYLDRQGSETDNLNELWHLVPVAEEIEGGTLTGKLKDLSGRFNLNNLSTNNALEVTRFKRLLEILGIEALQRDQLTAAIIDWLDADQTSQVGYGAEDDYYMSLAAPYRPHATANRQMQSLSELFLIKDMDQETLYKLRIFDIPNPETGDIPDPVFTVLPEHTSININTAPAEVLMALDSNITEDKAQDIITRRDGDVETGGDVTPFKNANEFKTFVQSQLQVQNFNITGISVKTEYFLLHATAEIDRGHMSIYSIIHRADSGICRTISRGQGIY